MTTARTICNFCHVHCPIVVELEGDRVVRVEADHEHPFGGVMCVKGKAAGELLDHPDRLLYPLRRIGPKTAPPRWERISWDQALDEIVKRLVAIRATSGAEAVVFAKGTGSGTGVADAERWLRRLADVFGTPNIVSTTHLCQWPRDEGTRYTYGVRLPPPDLSRAGCLLLWGCNPATTNIRFARDIQAARARGMKLVAVDPRRVGTAGQADLHLPVVPGTDGALALGLMHVLLARGWFDRDFVRDWTNAPLLMRRDTGRLLRWSEVDGADDQGFVAWAGWAVRYDPRAGTYECSEETLDLEAAPSMRLADGTCVETVSVFRELRRLVAEYPLERVAVLAGVEARQIEAAAEMLWQSRPVAHYFWNGITQHTNAAQNGRAISVLYALLGNFDAPGGNVVAPTAGLQSVALGGLLSAEQKQRQLGWADRPLGAARTSGSSAAHDVYRSVLNGEPYPTRALLAFGTNMIVSSGGSLQAREALQRLDLMVYTDFFMTPTAELADYVLPAATFLESPGVYDGWTYPAEARAHLQYRPAVVSPRGEARSDTQMIFDLGVRLGASDLFWQGNVEAGFAYELEPTGIALETLRAAPNGITPVDGHGLEGRSYANANGAGASGGFATPTHKVEIYATRFAEHGQDPLPRYTPPHWSDARDPSLAAEYPLVLTNAKVTQFLHSQGRALPSLRKARPQPQVELHPETAARVGVRDGAWVRVETPEGAVRVQAKLNSAIKPGVVVGQHGWWQACETLGLNGYAPFSADGANANLLVTNEHRDPISGGTPHRSARCRLLPDNSKSDSCSS